MPKERFQVLNDGPNRFVLVDHHNDDPAPVYPTEEAANAEMRSRNIEGLLDWQPIETAPKDGTQIWGWLYDSGIVLVHWMTAEQNCEQAGDDNPDDYIACWVKSGDPGDGDWSPKFWLPRDAIPMPPGVVWIEDYESGGRWRDIEPRRPR